MKNATADESGTLPVAPDGELGPRALLVTCHEILNAVSVLEMNVDFLAQDATHHPAADREEAARDARQSVQRITDIVRGIQRVARPSAR